MPNCTSPRYTRSLNLRLFQNPPPILTHNAAKNGIRGLAVLQLFFFAFFPFHFSRIGRRGRNTRSVLLTSPERAKNKRAQKKKNAHAGSRYYYRLSSLKLSITLFLQPKKRGGRRGGHPTRAKSGKPELAAPREEQKNEQRARLVVRRLTFSPPVSHFYFETRLVSSGGGQMCRSHGGSSSRDEAVKLLQIPPPVQKPLSLLSAAAISISRFIVRSPPVKYGSLRRRLAPSRCIQYRGACQPAPRREFSKHVQHLYTVYQYQIRGLVYFIFR